MKKLLKENKGSTLLTTMFFILVVALLTISLHLALISMIDKVYDDYDQQQAYVSARGIATTIAQGIDYASASEMGTINDTSIDDLTMDSFEINDDLLQYLEGITDNDEKTMTGITITDSNNNVLVLGDDVTGTIRRTDDVTEEDGTATYLLSITTTYGDATETVTLSITRDTVQYALYEENETTDTVTTGYLSGFYLDFMPYASSFVYSEDDYDGDDAILVCASPVICTNPDIYFSMKANFYCEGTIVLVGDTKKINGYDVWNDVKLGTEYIEFYSKEDIHLSGVTTIAYVDIMAAGDVYLYSGTVVGAYATVTCDTLYIDDNVTIGSDVTVNAKKIEFIGSDVSTVTVNTTNTEVNLASSKSSLTANGATIAELFGSTTYSATLVFSMAFPNRNIPTYVTEYESSNSITSVSSSSYSFSGSTSNKASSDNIIYTFYELADSITTTTTTTTPSTGPSNGPGGSGGSGGTTTTTTTVTKISEYEFSSSSFSNYSDTTPIVVVVPNGVTVTITNKIESSGVYFYLEGNAKLVSESTALNVIRVYSAQSSLQDTYEADMLACFNSYGGIRAALESNSTTNLVNIQTGVFSVLQTVYDNNAGIESANDGEIIGTITATILKASDVLDTYEKNPLEVEYNQSNDLGEANITRSEWITTLVDYNSYNVGVYIE